MLVTQQAAGRYLGVRRPSVTVIVARDIDDPHKDGQWSGAVSIGFTVRRR